MRRLALLALLAAAAVSCGGRRAPASDAAQLVPANALAYVQVAPGGLAKARASLPAFGAAGGAVPYLRAGATARLAGGIVSFAHPADEKRFVQRLGDEPHARVRGWIVYARTKALVDTVKRSKRSLAETGRYRRGATTQPAGAVVRAYEPLRRGWRTAALSLGGGNAKLEVHTPAPPGAPPGTLAGELPAGAAIAIAGAGGAAPPGSGWAIDRLSRLVGADVRALIAAAGMPYVLYAAPGAPVPDVTFAAAGRPPALAAAIRALAARLAGGPVPAGPAALDLGPVTLHVGPIAGQLVLSDADDPAAELLGGAKLSGSSLFRDASRAAALPQAGASFTYVDARRTLAAVRALAALANRAAPPALERLLAPVRVLLDWEAASGGVRTVTYLRMP